MTILEMLQAKNRDTSKIISQLDSGKFFTSVKSRNCDAIRCLVNNGVDINTKDEYGETALIHATDNADKKIVRLLIELGADINVQDDEGWTALMHAIFINTDKNADEIASLLIKNGANVNIKDNQGQTPLMIAADFNAKEIGELLILEGADIDAVDNQGMTAFDIENEKWGTDGFLSKEKVQEKSTTITNNKKNDTESPKLLVKEIDNTAETIKFLPSNTENQNFFFTKFNRAYGVQIDRTELLKEYSEKYDCSLDETSLCDLITAFNKQCQTKKLRNISENILQVIPSLRTVHEFVDSKLKNSYCNITNIKSEFLKEYKCELPDDILNDFKEYIKKINKQLFEEFNNKDYSYTVDIKTSFFKKYKSELSDDNLDNFIIWFNKQNNNKGLKRLDCGLIQVAPTDNIIQDFLSNEFNNKDYCYTVDIKSKFLKKYKSELSDDSLDRFIKDFNKSQHNKMLVSEKKYILVTLEPYSFVEILPSCKFSEDHNLINNLLAFFKKRGKFHQVLALLTQKKFLNELVGYSCSINELIKIFEDECSIPSIKREDIISSVQIANQNLSDIKIIKNDNTLKSSFKGTNMNSDNYDINICPVCGEKFNKFTPLGSSYHILTLHTSTSSYKSILVKKTDEEFFCNHCGLSKNFLNVKPGWIYRHLFGICKVN